MGRVVSGIRPTADLHLGNYFGALRGFIELENAGHECFFFVADVHALTTHPSGELVATSTVRTFATFLACGLSPERSVMYVQSHVPEVFELYTYLNMFAYKGELERCPTFKEKARQQPDNVNAGLLTYPVLMAADVLVHRGELVPVGKDQIYHLEMMRDFARRFNSMAGKEVFPMPRPWSVAEELLKVPGLDGSPKMSKTGDGRGAIFLTDTPEVIRQKVMAALTDSGPTRPNQPMSEPVANLFTLLELVSPPEVVEHFRVEYNTCKIRYVELKKRLAEDIIALVEPIRQQIVEWLGREEELVEIMIEGARRARESARQTLEVARQVLGTGMGRMKSKQKL